MIETILGFFGGIDIPALLVKLITAVGGIGLLVTVVLTFLSEKKCKAFGCKCGLFVDKFLIGKFGKGPGNKLGNKTLIPWAQGFIECMKRN